MKNDRLYMGKINCKIISSIFIIIVIIENIIGGINPTLIKGIQNKVFTPIMAIMIVYISYKYLKEYTKKEGFLFFGCFILWALFVCIYNSFWRFLPFIEIVFLSWGLFAFPHIISEKQRLILLNSIAYIYTILLNFFGVLAIIQSFAYVMGKPVEFIKKFNILISPTDLRLYIIIHPNLIGACYCIGIVFSLFIFFSSKRKVTKIYSLLSFIISIICISLTDSRNALFCTMITVGLCNGVYCYKKILVNSNIKRLCLSFIIFVFSLFVVYSVRLYPKEIINNYGEYYLEQHKDINVEKIELSNRDFIEETNNTLNGRTAIWGAVVSFIKDNPLNLIKGYKPSMEEIVKQAQPYFDGFKFYNTHSGYLYILAAFGIPGCIIILLFLFRMAINCIKVIFLNNSKKDYPIYILPTTVVALLLEETLEVAMTNITTCPCFPIFFLFLGYISFYANNTEKEV